MKLLYKITIYFYFIIFIMFLTGTFEEHLDFFIEIFGNYCMLPIIPIGIVVYVLGDFINKSLNNL